jgi:hypothetical protein
MTSPQLKHYRKNRDKLNAQRRTLEARARFNAYRRKWRGLPEPTRPCPAVCEICGQSPQKALHLDHDHLTNEFRGWLCNNCNLGIGSFRDSSDLLVAAARYLREKQL